MKETNVNKILRQIDLTAASTQWTFCDRRFYDTMRCFVLAVYMSNDQVTQMSTRDRENDVTYIISRERCSIISGKSSSYWQINDGVCQYESLEQDIEYIFQGLQYAYLRAE